MNRKDLVIQIAKMSEVDENNCDKVLHALETVLNEELSNSKGISTAIEKIYSLIGHIKNKKNK